VAGIEPGQKIFIGRNREPKNMLLLLDAWIELVDITGGLVIDFQGAKYSLALGRDPMTTALLLPVGIIHSNVQNLKAGSTDQPTTAFNWQVEQLFKAQGTMWAAKTIAVDFDERGTAIADVDVHLDWTVVPTDWWTWFTSWNALEVAPDGSLIDGERAYP